MVGATATAGLAARRWVSAWLAGAVSGAGEWPLTIESHALDKYGRSLATVWDGAGRLLNADILAAGMGRPYDGGKR